MGSTAESGDDMKAVYIRMSDIDHKKPDGWTEERHQSEISRHVKVICYAMIEDAEAGRDPMGFSTVYDMALTGKLHPEITESVVQAILKNQGKEMSDLPASVQNDVLAAQKAGKGVLRVVERREGADRRDGNEGVITKDKLLVEIDLLHKDVSKHHSEVTETLNHVTEQHDSQWNFISVVQAQTEATQRGALKIAEGVRLHINSAMWTGFAAGAAMMLGVATAFTAGPQMWWLGAFLGLLGCGYMASHFAQASILKHELETAKESLLQVQKMTGNSSPVEPDSA